MKRICSLVLLFALLLMGVPASAAQHVITKGVKFGAKETGKAAKFAYKSAKAGLKFVF